MPIGNDTHVYRGRMPHLVRPAKTYFVTFCTAGRRELSAGDRGIVLAECVRHHRAAYWLYCAIVMPDHVHLILHPYNLPLPTVIGRIKGASARAVHRGPVWQRDYFDRILRSDESLTEKADYIANNPVRKGLVAHPTDWPWLWSGGLQPAEESEGNPAG